MFAFLKKLFTKNNKKIKLGLALGSGGAKGFVHIGALQAFEEEKIYFDIVAGTSIGSAVGALYAMKKYFASEILKLAQNVNYADIITLPPVNMSMNKAHAVFSEVFDDGEINRLALPYAAVATGYTDGCKFVLRDGKLADAVCASCCYLPFFKPYDYNGTFMVDGAYVDPIPADVVKSMGADIIVGIDLSAVKRTPGKFEEMFKGKIIPNVPENPKKSGYDNSNLIIAPNLSAYTPFDIVHADEMFDIGYESAKKIIPDLKTLLGT